MKLEYSSIKDNDRLIITDFVCEPAQEMLKEKNLYKILWSKDQELNLMIDGYEFELCKNEVIFCTPLNVMEIPKEIEGLYSFVFNKEFFCLQTHDHQVSCNGFLFFGSSQPQRIKLKEKEIKHFDHLLENFKEDIALKDHLQGEMLRSLLKRMLIISTRMIKNELPQPEITNSHMNTIREYNLLVEKHFRELHHVKDYANLLFKSPKTLSNIFPKYSEKSPIEFINDRILLEAKRLLLYSDKSVEEISIELGYKDGGHFSKFFKKHEGKTPTVFRKSKRTIQ